MDKARETDLLTKLFRLDRGRIEVTVRRRRKRAFTRIASLIGAELNWTASRAGALHGTYMPITVPSRKFHSHFGSRSEVSFTIFFPLCRLLLHLVSCCMLVDVICRNGHSCARFGILHLLMLTVFSGVARLSVSEGGFG